MKNWGTCCIAPKIRGRTSKALYFCGRTSKAGGKMTANLPRGVLEPSKSTPRNYGAFEVCPAEFWSNATCATLSHGDIVRGAKIPTQMF